MYDMDKKVIKSKKIPDGSEINILEKLSTPNFSIYSFDTLIIVRYNAIVRSLIFI